MKFFNLIRSSVYPLPSPERSGRVKSPVTGGETKRGDVKRNLVLALCVGLIWGYIASVLLFRISIKEFSQNLKNQNERLTQIEEYLDRIGIIK